MSRALAYLGQWQAGGGGGGRGTEGSAHGLTITKVGSLPSPPRHPPKKVHPSWAMDQRNHCGKSAKVQLERSRRYIHVQSSAAEHTPLPHGARTGGTTQRARRTRRCCPQHHRRLLRARPPPRAQGALCSAVAIKSETRLSPGSGGVCHPRGTCCCDACLQCGSEGQRLSEKTPALGTGRDLPVLAGPRRFAGNQPCVMGGGLRTASGI